LPVASCERSFQWTECNKELKIRRKIIYQIQPFVLCNLLPQMNNNFDDVSDTFAAVSTLNRNFVFIYSFRERERNANIHVYETIISILYHCTGTLLNFVALEGKIVYVLSFRVLEV
jgi:hypothetical protein